MSQNLYEDRKVSDSNISEPKWLSDVKSELSKRLGDNITVHELARLTKMSDQELLRRFKEETGVALARYIHLARLKTALRLLHDPDMSLSEIARATGFGTLKHMAAVFHTERSRFQGELRRTDRIHVRPTTENFDNLPAPSVPRAYEAF